MQSKVRISIIDSGIDFSIYDLKDHYFESIGFEIDEHGYIIKTCNPRVKNVHGTAIACVIKDVCPSVEFQSINIFNEKLVADGRVLLKALEYAINSKPNIVHLSLGVTKWKYKFKLHSLVKKATKNNTIVVSATNNRNIKSYPACLKNVIGVKANNINNKIFYCKDENYFHAPNNIINEEILNYIHEAQFIQGTSISAAYITGYISDMCKWMNSKSLNNKKFRELLINNMLEEGVEK